MVHVLECLKTHFDGVTIIYSMSDLLTFILLSSDKWREVYFTQINGLVGDIPHLIQAMREVNPTWQE